MSEVVAGWNVTTGLLGAALLPVDPISGVSLLAGSMASGVANHANRGRQQQLTHENQHLKEEMGMYEAALVAAEHDNVMLSTRAARAEDYIEAQKQSFTTELNYQRATAAEELRAARLEHEQVLTAAQSREEGLRTQLEDLHAREQDKAARLAALERCRSAEETLALTEEALLSAQSTIDAAAATLARSQRMFVGGAVLAIAAVAGYTAYEVYCRYAVAADGDGWDCCDVVMGSPAPEDDGVLLPDAADVCDDDAPACSASDWDACSDDAGALEACGSCDGDVVGDLPGMREGSPVRTDMCQMCEVNVTEMAFEPCSCAVLCAECCVMAPASCPACNMVVSTTAPVETLL